VNLQLTTLNSDSSVEKVVVLTVDSRMLVGKLESFDQLTNLVGLPNQWTLFLLFSSTWYLYLCCRVRGIVRLTFAPLLFPQVLSNALERVIRTPEDPDDSETVPLGLYVVRGDNVCVVGLVDESIEKDINWSKVRGAAIGTTKH
jgi:small nuclear ribonucleoprotein (snRNP)-like protein